VFFKAKSQFRQGFPALAFGCSRLGAALSANHPKEFEAEKGDVWAFICQSLYHLPYRIDIDLLTSVLTHLSKCVEESLDCPTNLRVALLLALANIYQDNGMWSESRSLYKQIESSPTLPPNILASVSRRRALSHLYGDYNEPEIRYAFDKAYELNDDPDFRASLFIARAWKCLIEERPRGVLSGLEEYIKVIAKSNVVPNEILSAHNVFELAITSSAALHELGENYHNYVEIINNLHVDRPYTKLRPVFTNHIAKLTFSRAIVEHISTLSMGLIMTPSMLMLLDEISTKLLSIKETAPSPRRPWVD
jgi:hypothetical protein